MTALDEVSRLLGRMEQELISLRRENEILFRKVAEVNDKLDGHTVTADGFKSVIETVDRHEVLVQRGAGILVAITALTTTLGLFAREVVGWVSKKLGLL